MNEKIIRIIALTIVLSIVFASAGCTGNDTKKDADSIDEASGNTDDKTTTEDDLNIDTVDVDQIQADISDDELDNIEQELGDIDW